MLVKHSKPSVFHDILQELLRHDPEYFRRYLRMDAKVYEVGSSSSKYCFYWWVCPKYHKVAIFFQHYFAEFKKENA